MNVLVIGSGGREHMLVKTLNKSPRVSQVFAAPGNAGMSQEAICVNILETDFEALIQLAKNNDIEWTIVGPEVPLTQGIVNVFREAGLKIFGPTKEAAVIEGSKDFTKALMKKYQVPTADYDTFTDCDLAKAYIQTKGAPIVVKADGLAAGKGVVVAMTEAEAIHAVEDMLLNDSFGESGTRVVIEEFLVGEEFSLFAFVEGEHVYPMMPARDHKRAYDDDQGPNTGGMGAYSPVPDVTSEALTFTIEHVLKPVAKAMVQEGRPYTGLLYAGLIETSDGIKVIEFNARFGDPETQVILPLLENDLIDVIESVSQKQDPHLVFKEAVAVGTVVTAKGYPGAYESGIKLPSLPEDDDCYVIHAGTALEDNQIVSSGGRVLLVGAVKVSKEEARAAVYRYLEQFDATDEFFYRKDIGNNPKLISL